MLKHLSSMRTVISHLKTGHSVREVATFLGISYSRLCRLLRDLNLTNKGVLKDGLLSYTELFKSWLELLAKECKNIKEISEILVVSRDKVSSIYSTAGVFVTWKLEDNHNELLAASRRAELFVKNLGFRVVRDCYTCKSATHQKASYDLILEKWGSVDVKSSPVKKDKFGKSYVAFNTQNFTKGVKYAFCVALTSDRQDFVAVFAIPGKLVYGHSTIHISLEPLSKKYSEYLIWKLGDAIHTTI